MSPVRALLVGAKAAEAASRSNTNSDRLMLLLSVTRFLKKREIDKKIACIL